MLLNVQEIVSRQQPMSLQGTLDAAEILRHSAGYVPLGALAYRVEATPVEEWIQLTGELTCDVRMQCARCLESVDESLRVPFEERLRVVEDLEAEQDEDDDALPVAGERIDLTPILADEFLVALPYAPLCKEDCKGLCPNCGSNRNEQTCGCKTEAIDPRLAALQDWFKQE